MDLEAKVLLSILLLHMWYSASHSKHAKNINKTKFNKQLLFQFLVGMCMLTMIMVIQGVFCVHATCQNFLAGRMQSSGLLVRILHINILAFVHGRTHCMFTHKSIA